MWSKVAAVVGGIIVITILFVFLIIMHYEQVEDLKNQLHTSLLKNTELAKEFNQEKAELMERYVKKLDEQHSEYRQEIKRITQDYESRIQTLESKYQQELTDKESDYKEEIASLQSENERLNRLLDDPDKRIPILTAENNNLVKQILNYYNRELESYKKLSVEAKREFNQARMDPELSINVTQCRKVTNLLQRDIEAFKTFAGTYRMFLKVREGSFSELGLEPVTYQTKLDEALLDAEQAFSAMEKENNRVSEHRFKVSAQEDWQDAGIIVETGDIVYVLAKGEWNVRPRKYSDCTADGDANWPTKYRREEFDKINTGALIARLKNGMQVPINQEGNQGQKFSFRIETSGRLEFTINDMRRDDNSGNLDVRLVLKKARY